MAQGRKIPARTWRKFLKVFAERASSVGKACEIVGISTNAFYEHCGSDPIFADEVRKIRDNIRIPFAEDMLHIRIAQGDLGAIKYYLSNRGGRRWNDSKIAPITLKYEIEHPPPVKEHKQGLPTHPGLIAARAYEKAMFMNIKDIPATLTLDLSDIRARMKDEKHRKRTIEDNPDEYDEDGNIAN